MDDAVVPKAQSKRAKNCACAAPRTYESQRDEGTRTDTAGTTSLRVREGSLVVGREIAVDSVVPCQQLCLRLHSCEFCVEWDGVHSRNGEKIMWSLGSRLVDRSVGRLDGRVSMTLSTSLDPLLRV